MEIDTKYDVGDTAFIKNYSKPVRASVTAVHIEVYTNGKYIIQYSMEYSLDRGRCEPEVHGKNVEVKEMYDDKMECTKAILGLTGSFEELKI